MRHEFYIAGIFFVLPCIESYQKVDLRTITMGVPPQEVSFDEKCTVQWAACCGTQVMINV